MADEGVQSKNLETPQSPDHPQLETSGSSRRRRPKYQPDLSSGLASEEAEAERRGIEAAEADLPRQTRGLKLNYADVAKDRASIGDGKPQNPVPHPARLSSSPEKYTNAAAPPNNSDSSEALEPGSIPIVLGRDRKSSYVHSQACKAR